MYLKYMLLIKMGNISPALAGNIVLLISISKSQRNKFSEKSSRPWRIRPLFDRNPQPLVHKAETFLFG